MNHLEELKRELSIARGNWQWDEVRRLEAAIAAEGQRLEQTARDLPAPASDGVGPKKTASKKTSKKKTQRK